MTQAETREDLRERVLMLLNTLVSLDPQALHQLAEARVPVSTKLADARETDAVVFRDRGGALSLGLIGVINGILGSKHRIAGLYGDDGKLVHFQPFE